MNLEDLKLPFEEEEIEWRISRAEDKGKDIVATCLAYVSARAIMDRLDKVCGANNWKVEYRFIPASVDIEAGVICQLSIKIGEQWVMKEDGAEQTAFEPFKGGISSALKRAGSVWGIGRYLYYLDEAYAVRVDRDTKGAKTGKTKQGTWFNWIPPNLPAWALPDPTKVRPEIVIELVENNSPPPVAPAEVKAMDPKTYIIPFNKDYMGKRLDQIPDASLKKFSQWTKDQVKITKNPLTKQEEIFIATVDLYLKNKSVQTNTVVVAPKLEDPNGDMFPTWN